MTRRSLGVVGAVSGIGLASITLARKRLIVIRIVGESMSPTFAPGQRIIMSRSRTRDVECGDVIAFRTPENSASPPEYRVKRVHAVAGDIPPSWLTAVPIGAHLDVIPAGYVVVRGDAPVTEDSTHLGLIPTASIVGSIAWLDAVGS